ncbi:MAG: IS4 family transposase [Methylocella sp.]
MPLIAADAIEGALLGLIDARFFVRNGGKAALHKNKTFAEKESRRWLDGAESAAGLLSAGAACVTVAADREGGIYEDFACKPEGIEVLIRAGQDRLLTGGSRLFERSASLPEAGRMTIELPAAPGRPARRAVIALRFASVEIARPPSRRGQAEINALPPSVTLSLVEALEADPPEGMPCAHWRLLTSHKVADVAGVRRMVAFYRERWTIEQLFRTLKTKGFDVEALRLAEGPFEKLVAASLVAAVTMLQLVRERDGAARRPLEDAIDKDEQAALEAVSKSLEGKTGRQKNPHPKGSLAYAAWVFARLGGWTGYYGKPGPVVMLHGLVQFHAIKHGWTLRHV